MAEAKVNYVVQMITKKSDTRIINYSDVDNYDFSKHFIEVINKPEYVHLYFDFDEITTREEYEDVYDWLECLSVDFGKYSIGGYTNDNEQFGDLFKYIPNAHHVLSLHVVFYETKIKAQKLINLMKHTKDGYKYKIHRLCDPNVYKLNSEQKMRHVLSDKIYSQFDNKNKITAGSFLNSETKPSESIITIRGDEEEINDTSLYALFRFDDFQPEKREIPDLTAKHQKKAPTTIKKPKEKAPKIEEEEDENNEEEEEELTEEERLKKENEILKKQLIKIAGRKQKTIEGVEFEDELILFNYDEMITFLNHFDNCSNTILHDLVPLYHSPYDKEFLISCVSEWYEQAEHTDPKKAEVLINNYHTKENNNKWFFSLIKKLDDETRNEYLNTYAEKSIDFSININNSNITYNDVKMRRYDLENMAALLNDLRGCVGVIDDVWYLKILSTDDDANQDEDLKKKTLEGQPIIIFMNEEKLQKKLKTFKPFRGNNKINLYQIVSKFSNLFMYRAARMSKNNQAGVINLFQGFKHQEIQTEDFSILQPFLKHIEHIICNDDKDKYKYFMAWYANIFQNITVKNGTLPIVWGAQGSGKSFAVEVFCDLLGYYSLANVDDLDKVFGKFNGLIGQHLLININEPPEATEKFAFNGKIKSKLTQKKHIQETKGIDQIEMNSWANYSMTTNNSDPIRSEKGDRRSIYFAVNNEKCGDEEYFNNLCKPIQPEKQGPYNKEFMGVLLHYMRTQIDLTGFNPERLIRNINANIETDYNEQLERQYADLPAVDKFVVDNYKLFLKGVSTEFLESHMSCFPNYKLAGVQKKLNALCDKDRRMINGKRTAYYKLKDEKQIPDLYNIIKYAQFNEMGNDETDEQELFNKFD